MDQMFTAFPPDVAGNLDYKNLVHIITHGEEKDQEWFFFSPLSCKKHKKWLFVPLGGDPWWKLVYFCQHKRIRAEVSSPGFTKRTFKSTNTANPLSPFNSWCYFCTLKSDSVWTCWWNKVSREAKLVYLWRKISLTDSPFVSKLGRECTAGGPLYPPRSVGNICDNVAFVCVNVFFYWKHINWGL